MGQVHEPGAGDRGRLQCWWILARCFPLSSFCAHLPTCSFCFLSNFEAEKVMKRPTCFELVLILGLSLSAGTKVIAKPILLSVLLLYFSFSFLRFFLFYPLVFGFLSGFSFRSPFLSPGFFSPHFLRCSSVL